MKLRSSHRIFAAAAAGLALYVGAPLTAQARDRSTTVHGGRGGVYQRQVHRTPGNFGASGSAVLPNGKSASRSLSSQKTETGRTTSARATGFNGKTAAYDSTRTRTDSGYTRQVNVAGPNGGTGTKQVNVSNQDGTVTRTVTRSSTPPNP